MLIRHADTMALCDGVDAARARDEAHERYSALLPFDHATLAAIDYATLITLGEWLE